MSLKNQEELDNTKRKLGELEQLYAEQRDEPTANPQARELTLVSLKRTINRLKEEIARYESRSTAKRK